MYRVYIGHLRLVIPFLVTDVSVAKKSYHKKWQSHNLADVFQDLANDCARYLAQSQSFPPVANPSYNSIVHQIRSQPKLSQLVTRCYET